MAIRSSIVAALGAKTAVGAAVVALGAGAAAGTVATGSVNPVNWGQRVVQQVEKCEQPATGNRGECVSDFAKAHGPAVRAQHAESAEASPSPARSPKPGERNGQAAGHANGNSAGAQGQSQAQAHGQGNPPVTPGANGQASSNGHAEGRPTPGASPKG